MHQHRVVFSYLHDKEAVKELFTVVAPKVAAVPVVIPVSLNLVPVSVITQKKP